jgi:lipopolysaccharide export system protein LptC
VVNSYRLYPIIMLALLAGASVWLERVTRVDEPAAEAAEQTGPDFIAEHTRVVGYGANGAQRYELFADRLSHFPQGDITRLDMPRLRMINEGRETHITALHAEVSPGGEQVDMQGEVRVRRPAVADDPALALDSETLTVWPDTHRAHTDSPVQLTRGSTRADAQGMRADNLFGTLELIGQVHVNMPRRQGSAS